MRPARCRVPGCWKPSWCILGFVPLCFLCACRFTDWVERHGCALPTWALAAEAWIDWLRSDEAATSRSA